MKYVVMICRILLGVGFVVFGTNILVPFMPQPPMTPGSPEALFMEVMGPSHWMFLIGTLQLVGGMLVLLGRTTPMGLALLAPVLVNILAFHTLLLHGAGIVPGLAFSVMEVILIYAYREYFKPLVSTEAVPNI